MSGMKPEEVKLPIGYRFKALKAAIKERPGFLIVVGVDVTIISMWLWIAFSMPTIIAGNCFLNFIVSLGCSAFAIICAILPIFGVLLWWVGDDDGSGSVMYYNFKNEYKAKLRPMQEAAIKKIDDILLG